MPVLESVVRETMRLVFSATLLRRNVVEDLHVGDKLIHRGDFMAYSVGDVHLNADIYLDPLRFDPGRFDSPREEDKRGNAVFLGWGTGRHPCTGMKVAKLEIKMIIALFLTRYDFIVTDASGKATLNIPKPDRNDMHQVSFA